MKARKTIVALTILGIMVLVLSLTLSMVGAKNPPPPGDHFRGPALIANLTFTPDPECEVIPGLPGVVFTGSADCMGQTFDIPVNDSCCTTFSFDEVNEDDLKGFMFDCENMPPDWIPERCVPDVGFITGLFIQAVLEYSESPPVDPTVKEAKVILLFVVP